MYPDRLPVFHRFAAEGEAADLASWFWTSQWSLEPGSCSRQELLAFPACNLVVETDRVGLSGPSTRASHRDLVGVGWAVAALLRPAAVPGFTADPTTLRDQYVELSEPELHRAVALSIGSDGPEAAVGVLSRWLLGRAGAMSADAQMANEMARVIGTDAAVRTLADVCDRLAVSERTLHRLARRHVGLTPAVMIRRRRLQEAAERVRTDPDADLASIAAELGYADQAHLAREFRQMLGFTASDYRRELAD